MILLPPIQVFEGDGRNPAWDHYLHGDNRSIAANIMSGYGHGTCFGDGPSGLTDLVNRDIIKDPALESSGDGYNKDGDSGKFHDDYSTDPGEQEL